MSGPSLAPAPDGPWAPRRLAAVGDLYDLVCASAERFTTRTYLRPAEDGLDPVDFTGVRRFAEGLNAYLDERGVPQGGRVGVVLHNSTLAALLFLGVIAARRVLVPLNPKSAGREFAYILRRTNPGLVLFDPASESRIGAALPDGRAEPLADERAFLRAVLQHAGAPGSRPVPGAGRAEADAEIVFTSGSSGDPKGVVLSHRSLIADSFALGARFSPGPQDRFLTVCPLFHNSGQVFTTLTPLWCGACTTTVRSEVGMARFWQYVDRFEPHWTLVVNAFLGLLVSREPPRSGGSLRGLLSGGSRLSPDLIDAFESAFNTPVYQVYGLTETTSVSTCETEVRPRRVRGSAGVPLPCCEVRIVTDGADAPTGTPGEVWISGANLLTGYLDHPELTAQKLVRPGPWLRTGDLGTMDEDGNVHILDRLDDMVIVGGENVYPSELENVVPHLPDVLEAAAVGVPHAVMGHELMLVYTPKPGTEPDLTRWREIFTGAVSTFKVPRRFLSTAALGLPGLPRAANGKILRGELTTLTQAWSVAEAGGEA